jgi:hypothetical protein
MHLFAFGVYAICVASYECSLLWKRLRVERRLRTSLLRIPFSAAVSLIVPMLVWFNPLSGSDRPDYYRAVFGPIHWGNPWWAHGAESTLWISLAKKVDGLASPIFYSDPIFEIPLLLIIFAIFVWALATRAIVQNPRMIIPLGAFAGTYLVMPYALGEIGGLDYRFPSAVAFIALVSFGWGKASPARINVVRLLLAVCLIVRVGSVFSEWQPAQAIIAEYDTALRLVPPGSRLLVIVGHDEFWGSRKQPLVHIPELPAAKRGILDPLLFDIYGGTLLNLKPDYRGYSRKGDPTGASRYSDVKSFDYLMEIRQPPVEIPAGITLDEIERGRTFVLYRIEQQRLPSEG